MVWFRFPYRDVYGKHRPFCGGLCLVASTGWKNLSPVSFGFIIVPSMVWYGLVSKNVSDSVSPIFPFIVNTFIVLTIVFLLFTMFTEPGILATITYEEYDETKPDIPIRIVSKVLLDGREHDLRQFRAKFSRCTENCIENFDHYCPWVGNVIGKRNYRYFILFMCCCLILAASCAAGCTMLLVRLSVSHNQPFAKTIRHNVAATVLGIYGYGMFFSLIGLCGFYVRAIFLNMTRNEILKNVYNEYNRNPHDRGFRRNCLDFLCSPVPASRVARLDFQTPLLHDVLVGDSFDENLLEFHDGIHV